MNEWPEQYPGLDVSPRHLKHWESHAKTLIVVCVSIGFAGLLMGYVELAHASNQAVSAWSSLQGWFTDGWNGAYDAGATGAF